MSLDLTGKLPSPSEIAWIKENPQGLPALIANYAASAEARATITRLHRDVWRLSSESLSELDRFQQNDPELKTKLATVKEEIINEPLLRLRYILDTARPFSDLFTGNWTILHPTLIDLYQLTEDQAPWPHEIYRFAEYPTRPSLGVLMNNALLASESNFYQDIPYHRTLQLLRRFHCSNHDQPNVHNFAGITENFADLDQYARFQSPCRGCHALWSDIAESFAGMGMGEDFSEWLTYQGNPESTGIWSGTVFNKSSELGSLIGNDPRIHQCELMRLTGSILQRPLTQHDSTLIGRTADEFYRNRLRLMTVLPVIMQSKDYGYDAVSPEADLRYLRTTSGVRFLRQDHWRQIIQQFTYGGDSIDLPPTLNAGQEEVITFEDQIPSGGYWYTVDRVARELAAKIVAEELSDRRSATSRRVLTLLPDGSGVDADLDTIHQQILTTWTLLTSDDSSDPDQSPLRDFIGLWGKLATTSDAEFRQAWSTLLTAMLSHPLFLRY